MTVLGGILLALLGFAISVASLGLASTAGARMLLVLVGIGVSLFAIIGVINRQYVKNAIWRR